MSLLMPRKTNSASAVRQTHSISVENFEIQYCLSSEITAPKAVRFTCLFKRKFASLNPYYLRKY